MGKDNLIYIHVEVEIHNLDKKTGCCSIILNFTKIKKTMEFIFYRVSLAKNNIKIPLYSSRFKDDAVRFMATYKIPKDYTIDYEEIYINFDY